jgi:hypothetical protein
VPTKIHTLRLRLRALVPGYATTLQQVAGAHGIADTRISVVQPYPPGEAARLIAHCRGEGE